MPLPCSLFGVLYRGRLKPQWEPPPRASGFDHHIWFRTLRWSSGLFLSKQQHVHVAPKRHTWSQCKGLLFSLFPALKLKSGLWAQLIGQKYLVAKDLYGLKIGDYCISGSSFSIQGKTASISVPDFLRIGQRIFWQFLMRFCPMVQSV